MHDDAQATHERKRDKAQGDQVANEFIEQQHEIVPCRLIVKLAVAGMSEAKLVR